MSLADYYRILGLRTGASFADVKAAYRRLARKYHPDVNPGNQRAKERFIKITQAYDALADFLQPEETVKNAEKIAQEAIDDGDLIDEETPVEPYQPPSPVRVNPSLSALEQQLKQDAYQQLQELLKKQKYPRAIALVEGLAQRISQDAEVRQWQAITYQRWARYLIGVNKLDKARIYLNKALRTDPMNKSLWAEINRDFQQIDKRV
ncbi:MAG: J domain-containing protein [Leptolyngbya sp. SIO4C1]|nr:J domain-containing protein [Leptolyngbya sp. SIO4C1]